MKYHFWKMQDETVDPEFEAMLTARLEQRAEVLVPADFAARVRGALPAVKPARRRVQLGRTVTFAAMGVLAVALFALAPHAAPTFGNVAFDLELMVLVELGGLAYWVAGRRGV